MRVTRFKASNMPVTLLRKRTGQPFDNPGWTRLQQHIARHEKAGGIAYIRHKQLDKPIKVEGFKCIALVDVELLDPSTFI